MLADVVMLLCESAHSGIDRRASQRHLFYIKSTIDRFTSAALHAFDVRGVHRLANVGFRKLRVSNPPTSYCLKETGMKGNNKRCIALSLSEAEGRDSGSTHWHRWTSTGRTSRRGRLLNHPQEPKPTLRSSNAALNYLATPRLHVTDPSSVVQGPLSTRPTGSLDPILLTRGPGSGSVLVGDEFGGGMRGLLEWISTEDEGDLGFGVGSSGVSKAGMPKDQERRSERRSPSFVARTDRFGDHHGDVLWEAGNLFTLSQVRALRIDCTILR